MGNFTQGMCEAEFFVSFPEPSPNAARLHHVFGDQLFQLLWLTGNALPEDCRELRGLIATVLTEVNRGEDTTLLRRIGLQLLGLAYPVISEYKPEIRDRIERLLAEDGRTDEDDVPY
jgi:hypothetical protein